jgi:transcription termination/antitermination protein NusA
VRHAGYLDGFDLSRAEAEALIMAARLKAGWIEALPEPEGEDGAEEGAEEGAEAAEGEEAARAEG